MIQANELRIGNWVYELIVDLENGGNKLNKTKIDGNRIKCVELGDIIHPIPLTPEILVKCGFEVDNKTSYGGWLSPNIGTGKIRLVKEDVGFSFF